MRRRITNVRILAATALLGLAGLWPAAPARADAPAQSAGALQLEVRLGFDGYMQPGAWTPITVTAGNDGPDISGELRVEVDPLTGSRTLYTRAIDLPRGSRKAVTLYVADLTAFGSEVRVDLAERGRVVASERVRLFTVSPTTLLIGVWSDAPQGLAALGTVKPSSGEVRVALLGADDLPASPVGWQALDALVVADADTGQLSPDQRAALRGWLAGGGRLIVVGGAGFQRTLSGLSDLLPVSVEGAQTASLAPLADLAGAPFVAQAPLDSMVASGPLVPGARMLAQTDGVALAASRSLGYGHIAYLAADPNLEPLRSWDGMEALWRALLTGSASRPAWAFGFASQWEFARQAVAAVPGVSLPSVIQLCGFLLLYVVLIGPVNYAVLSRLKRRELAWFTIPALILLFSAVAYVTGFQLRGSRAILHRLAVIQSWAGEDVAQVNGLVGVWSPRRARYDVALEPGYLARPMPRDLGGVLTAASDTQVDQGEAIAVRGLRVDVGSIQPLVVEGFTTRAPTVSGDLTLRAGQGGLHVSGVLSNAADLPLRDVSLAIGGSVAPLGDLPAGQVLQVDVELPGGQASRAPDSLLDPFPASGTWGYGGGYDAFVSGVAGSDCYATPDDRRRCNLLLGMLNGQSYGSGLYLFGWADSVPFSTQVIGGGADVVDSALIVVALPASLSVGAQGTIDVPPGLMTWRTLEDAFGYTMPYDLYLYAGQTATFRFEPSALVPPLVVETLSLRLETPYSVEPPLVMLRNVQTGRWDALALVDYGITPVQEAARYVDAAGGVEARLLAPSDSFGLQISRFDVALRGTPLTDD